MNVKQFLKKDLLLTDESGSQLLLPYGSYIVFMEKKPNIDDFYIKTSFLDDELSFMWDCGDQWYGQHDNQNYLLEIL